MKALIAVIAIALCEATLAQSPMRTFRNPPGFSYAIPADWEVVDYSAQAKEQARQNATTEEAKKGLQCTQMDLMARHGTPSSVIVEVALPFDCYGQTMTDSALAGFGTSVSEGLRQNLDLGTPMLGAYTRGTHSFWIERANGTLKANPAASYTIEIACSALKKAAVCWMTMAADPEALTAFEHGIVTLEGDAPVELVPPAAFDKKPS